MNSRYKAIFAAMIGNALEYYDVLLYGFFATMLAPLFFPTSDPAVALISSFGVFAAGFVMRPLGGIVFGHIGDKFGRRQALALAIFLVTIPTLTIGLLPTYETIGIAAPIILITCRLLQGLCVGGEYAGAALFAIEHAAKGREAFAGSLLTATGFFGGVIGTFFGFICTLPFMPSWGWRIPFLLGSIIGLFGYHLRKQIGESPEFLQYKDKAVINVPLFAVLKDGKRNLLCAMGIGVMAVAPFYMASICMGHVLTSKLHVVTSDVMLITVGLNLAIVVMFPLMGLLADKVGREKLMITTAVAAMGLAYPLFYMLEVELSVARVIMVQLALGAMVAGFAAPNVTVMREFFPINQRYSGIGFGYALGGALFGGTTPLILATLGGWFHPTIANTGYLIFSGFMGMAAVIWGKKYKG